MGCKCGAMVKASANGTGTALWVFGSGAKRGQGAGVGFVQKLGTIDAGSKATAWND